MVHNNNRKRVHFVFVERIPRHPLLQSFQDIAMPSRYVKPT